MPLPAGGGPLIRREAIFSLYRGAGRKMVDPAAGGLLVRSQGFYTYRISISSGHRKMLGRLLLASGGPLGRSEAGFSLYRSAFVLCSL